MVVPAHVFKIVRVGTKKAGGAVEALLLFPKTLLAAALFRVKVRAGVVVAVATAVVNSGDRLPAEKDVTVPMPEDVTVKVMAFVLVVVSNVHPDAQIRDLNPGTCGEYILNPEPILGGKTGTAENCVQYANPSVESSVNTHPLQKLVKFKGMFPIVSALQFIQALPPLELNVKFGYVPVIEIPDPWIGLNCAGMVGRFVRLL